MPHQKQKPPKKTRRSRTKPKQASPLVISAEASLPPEARLHADYKAQWFQERDLEGGIMDGVRMERISCVRALEGLARRHPKAKSAFLKPYHLMAANAYHADLLGVRGQKSHELRESIDVSTDVELAMIYRVEAQAKLVKIQNRMPSDLKHVMDTVLVSFPDQSLNRIWPNRSERDKMKAKIKEGLEFLAHIYGLTSG